MQYNYKYRLTPDEAARNELRNHIDVCRQLYNHCLYKLNESEDGIPTRYDIQGQLPNLKKWWTDLKGVHSKVLQMVVKRVYDNLSTLKAQKDNGRAVGMLRWKRPRDYRSLTYNQTGHQKPVASGWQPESSAFWRRLQAQEYERSAPVVVEQNRRYSGPATPRHPRRFDG